MTEPILWVQFIEDVFGIIFCSVVAETTKWNLSETKLLVITSNCHCQSRTTRLEEVIQQSVNINLNLTPIKALHLVVKVEGQLNFSLGCNPRKIFNDILLILIIIIVL